MGVRADLEAAKKALTDAMGKVDAALKNYEEKKKKGTADLKKAEVAVDKLAKAASSGGGGGAALKEEAKAAAAAIAACASAASSS